MRTCETYQAWRGFCWRWWHGKSWWAECEFRSSQYTGVLCRLDNLHSMVPFISSFVLLFLSLPSHWRKIHLYLTGRLLHWLWVLTDSWALVDVLGLAEVTWIQSLFLTCDWSTAAVGPSTSHNWKKQLIPPVLSPLWLITVKIFRVMNLFTQIHIKFLSCPSLGDAVVHSFLFEWSRHWKTTDRCETSYVGKTNCYRWACWNNCGGV